ncbi:MAG: hypothetical protein DRP37_07845 [Thermodesulfobacteriota bacterium]|nr:MAG: hypothetical protein DRP37_07845 [Thermodesulfobacteriota bacterium]
MSRKREKIKGREVETLRYTLDKARIKMIMLHQDLTVVELAKRLGCSRQNVYGILLDGTLHNMKTVRRMANVLGVAPWEILKDCRKRLS